MLHFTGHGRENMKDKGEFKMSSPKAIAVVGLGAILPDAYDVASFWNNVLNKKVSIGEVPPDRWDTALYYDPDPKAIDKTYTKIGAFVKDYQFDPFKNGIAIPPRVLSVMDPAQKWGLAASHQALKDYGYPSKPLDPERVAVILGNANAGEGHYRSTFRIYLPEYLESLNKQRQFRDLPEAAKNQILAGITADIHARIPLITEDTMPGELANIIAGRIANIYNFSGPNFITDAACASSLAAIQAAVSGLENNQFDAVLTGGVDRSMGPESYVKFSKIGALSAEGSYPYSDKASGFVMGEGAVIFLLKRAEDAERDGDKIYALIRGIGASSDGKGKGITAPNPLGQQRAITRAVKDAGIELDEIGLIEGHGTSTQVGDVVEVGSLNSVFGSSGLKNGSIALGSVKSNIGHLKSAAGAVGLLKTILALNERTLPPSANYEKQNPNIDFANIPVSVNTQPRAWEVKDGKYRYAGVSSFGFGGTNFHMILEEYFPGILGKEKNSYAIPLQIKTEVTMQKELSLNVIENATNIPGRANVGNKDVEEFVLNTVSQKTGYPREMLDLDLDLEADLGIDTVKQAELFATIRTNYDIPRREDLRLSEYNTLTKVVGFVCDALGDGKDATGRIPTESNAEKIQDIPAGGSSQPSSSQPKPYHGLYFLSADTKDELEHRLSDKISSFKSEIWPDSACPSSQETAKPERLAIDYENTDELIKRCEKALSALQTDVPATWTALQAHGIYRGRGTAGKVAFMFPGQGSQYVNMLRDLRDVEPVVRDTLLEADEVMTPILGKPLTSYIFADGNEEAIAQAEKELKNTSITQPALLTINIALLRLMNKFGFSPDFVIGHSLGEYAALVASGVLTFAEALEVVSARGREMSRIKVDDNGCMAAVSAPLEVVEEVLKSVDGYLVIANINSPVQSVLGGATAAIDLAIEKFKEKDFQAVKIPVSHAFHTKIVAPASEPLRRVIERMQIKPPAIPIVANVTGEIYPKERDEIINLLAQQVASPVQFVKSMQTLYDQGARVFVEIGPKRVLNAVAADNLKGKPDVTILATNHPRKGGTASFNEALCGLYAAGITRRESDPSIPSMQSQALSVPIQVRVTEPSVTTNKFAVLTGSVVVSGAGLGLPGRNGKVFADGNIASMLDGVMRIDSLPENTRHEMLGKRITRLIKSDAGAVIEEITDIEQIIKLAGQRGDFDLEEDFGVPRERIEALDISTQLAIAAGIEALRDAGIPLVMHHRRTSKGTYLPDGWKLPVSMQDDTGVIFCSAFPGLNRMAEEIERFSAAQMLQRQLDDLNAMEDVLVSLNPSGQTQFQNELQRRKLEIEAKISEIDYHFDRRFIFRILAMGHAQFAEYIGARGPNTHVNAACSTTTHATAVAEDWIRTGRCRRVVIIAGDDVTNEKIAPWIGTGMFANGAATIEGDLRMAALPFDRRRNGLIMGMGAAALVIESEDSVRERGVRSICEILSSQIANSAYHGTRLDVQHVGDVMERLVATAEGRFGIQREAIAPQLVFVSHETYTPARGGSASAEINALRRIFRNSANRIVIANTKGFTGHTMGVGVEDVIAVKALETGKVPPIAHIHDAFEPDPELGDLNLSKGSKYDPQYALRLGAGFGSQIAMVLYRRVPGSGERINQQIYNDWLGRVSGYKGAELEVEKRTLRIKYQGVPVIEPIKSTWQFGQLPLTWASDPGMLQSGQEQTISSADTGLKEQEVIKETGLSPTLKTAEKVIKTFAADDDAIRSHILAVVSEKTGYPVEMLDLELDLEADLGIDTVKQAELFAAVRTHYGIPRREDLRLAEYNTLEKVIGFVKENIGETEPDVQLTTESVTEPASGIAPHSEAVSELSVTGSGASSGADEDIQQFVLQIVSEKTGYPIEMLDLDLDLEADLGIDTVKQAELFAAVRTNYGIPKREDLRLAEYNTLAKVIGFVREASVPAVTSEKESSQPRSEEGISVETPSEPSPTAAPDITMNPLRRRVPQPVLISRIELSLPSGVVLEGGRVLIIKGQDAAYTRLVNKLEAKNVEVFVYEEGSALEAAKEWIQKGSLLGVYCLTGLDADPRLDNTSYQDWEKVLEGRLESLFLLSKIIPANAFLITATRMGGLHGFMNPINPLGGALSGFTKAYSRERRDAFVKVVDFEIKAHPEFVANCLIQETLKDPASLEVGRQGELRFTITLLDQPVDVTKELGFSQKSVFVVSGGSGGITGAVIEDLAQRSKGSFYLLGRTSLEGVDKADLRRLTEDRKQFKEDLIKRLSSNGERITPVLIEERLTKLERIGATFQLMEQVKNYGGQATYIQCDVTDPEAVSQAITKIAGVEDHVDTFIHAAGLERSRALESKSLEEFQQIVRVKTAGFLNIFASLEKAGRLPGAVVFFSSVAGRFGNAGQVDYSAGNDFLSKMSYWLSSRYPAVKCLSIDWGAWAKVGMASRGSIPAIMKRAGIEMLQPAQAAAIVGDELLHGRTGEVVIAGSLGLLESQKVKDHGVDIPAADAALREGTPIHTMLSHLTSFSAENGITLEVTLDPKELTFLQDHSINGIPVLPGVVGIEGFAIAAKHISSVLAAQNSGFEIERLENIEFLTPIKFYGNKARTLVWKAMAVRIAEGLQVRVSLESDIERKTGKIEHFQHFKGLVYLTVKHVDAPHTATPPKWGKNKEVTAAEIYRLYFHGPSFQVLEAAQRSGNSVLGRFNRKLVEVFADDPNLFTAPLLIELCFQTAGLWEAGSTGVLGLPHSIGGLKIYRKFVDGISVYADVKPKERDGQVYFDARVLDAEGNVYLDLTDYCTSPRADRAETQLVEPMKSLLAKEKR